MKNLFQKTRENKTKRTGVKNIVNKNTISKDSVDASIPKESTANFKLSDKPPVVTTTLIANKPKVNKKGSISLSKLKEMQHAKIEEKRQIEEMKLRAIEEQKKNQEERERRQIEYQKHLELEKEKQEKELIIKKNLSRLGIFKNKEKLNTKDIETKIDENNLVNSHISKEQNNFKSPICCILGHVDTGKTKLLDKLRESNIQENEAGGITQQIGATFFPSKMLANKCGIKIPNFPGILIIDTPGHESFANLRSRGSSICNLAIVVIDICHSLESQTIESIRLLREKKIPFIVALNKIDRIYEWQNHPYEFFNLNNQTEYTQKTFYQMLNETISDFGKLGYNAKLFYENDNYKKYVSLVPTSAITGEGIPDLIKLFLDLSEKFMLEKMRLNTKVECTILEVKITEGFGITLDVILSNGTLHQNSRIIFSGLDGPLIGIIKSILVPQALKELRVKSEYTSVPFIKASAGIKLVVQTVNKEKGKNGLETAIAGSKLYLLTNKESCQEGYTENEAIKLLNEDFEAVVSKSILKEEGIHVAANTLGSLEALLSFLNSQNIPVSNISLGKINKKSILKCGKMDNKFYRIILSFNVPLEKELLDLAKKEKVVFFMASIIYHLLDFYKDYTEKILNDGKLQMQNEAIFPVHLQILPKCVFCSRSPLILGVKIIQGTLKLNTPLAAIHNNEICRLGKVTSIEENKKPIIKATKGSQVAIKIEIDKTDNPKMVDRHFKIEDPIYSIVTRKSINVLKEFFKDELDKDHIELLFLLKKKYEII